VPEKVNEFYTMHFIKHVVRCLLQENGGVLYYRKSKSFSLFLT
jgi:hypothetical protein